MADVVRIFAPEVPQCADCGAAHKELGTLCAKCRKEAEPAAAVCLQATAASVIRDLRLWEQQGFPLAGPVGEALKGAQKLYDATEPRIQIAKRGEVLPGNGGHWVHLDLHGRPLKFGPYDTEEEAHEALEEFEGAGVKP